MTKKENKEVRNYYENVKQKVDAIEKSDLPKEMKTIGEMGAVMDVPNDSIIHAMVSAGDAMLSEKASAEAPKQKEFANYTPVEKQVAKMLTEDTGAAIMDSGGAYGRYWQENRKVVDFRSRPYAKVETDVDEEDPKNSEIIVYLDTFHFLVDRLHITPESEELEKKFEQYDREHPDDDYLQEMEDFANKIGENSGTVNTYNGEDALDQTLQYVYFEKDGKYFVLLQIHGGADVRGGYTEPYIFEVEEPEALMDNADLYAATGSGSDRKYWDSDDAGYHWYYEGSTAKPKNRKDAADDNGIPPNWVITKDGVYYAPTGELIDFGNDGIFNGKKAPLKLNNISVKQNINKENENRKRMRA